MSDPAGPGRQTADGPDGGGPARLYGWLKFGVGPAIGVGAGGGAGVGAIFGDPGVGAAVGAAIGVVVGLWISSRGRKRSGC